MFKEIRKAKSFRINLKTEKIEILEQENTFIDDNLHEDYFIEIGNENKINSEISRNNFQNSISFENNNFLPDKFKQYQNSDILTKIILTILYNKLEDSNKTIIYSVIARKFLSFETYILKIIELLINSSIKINRFFIGEEINIEVDSNKIFDNINIIFDDLSIENIKKIEIKEAEKIKNCISGLMSELDIQIKVKFGNSFLNISDIEIDIEKLMFLVSDFNIKNVFKNLSVFLKYKDVIYEYISYKENNFDYLFNEKEKNISKVSKYNIIDVFIAESYIDVIFKAKTFERNSRNIEIHHNYILQNVLEKILFYQKDYLKTFDYMDLKPLNLPEIKELFGFKTTTVGDYCEHKNKKIYLILYNTDTGKEKIIDFKTLAQVKTVTLFKKRYGSKYEYNILKFKNKLIDIFREEQKRKIYYTIDEIILKIIDKEPGNSQKARKMLLKLFEYDKQHIKNMKRTVRNLLDKFNVLSDFKDRIKFNKKIEEKDIEFIINYVKPETIIKKDELEDIINVYLKKKEEVEVANGKNKILVLSGRTAYLEGITEILEDISEEFSEEKYEMYFSKNGEVFLNNSGVIVNFESEILKNKYRYVFIHYSEKESWNNVVNLLKENDCIENLHYISRNNNTAGNIYNMQDIENLLK